MVGIRAALAPGISDHAAQFPQTGGGTELVAPAIDSALAPDGLGRFAWAFWFELAAFPAAGTFGRLVTVDAGAVNTDLWDCDIDGTTQKLRVVCTDGAAYHSLETDVLSLNTWYLAICTLTQTPTIQISLYDVNHHINSYQAAGGVRLVTQPNAPLKVGGGLGGAAWANCRIDSLMFWQGPFPGTGDELTLWNNGLGLRGIGDVGPGTFTLAPSRIYPLDETSGARRFDTARQFPLSGFDANNNPVPIPQVPKRGLF